MVSVDTPGWDRSKRRPDPAPRPRAPRWLRFGILGVLLLAAAAVVGFGAPQLLSLDTLRADRASLAGFVHAHPAQSLMLYVSAFALVVTLSLPGALVMTLSGGFLFGALEGGAAAVTGVWLGSIIMFLLARTALGEGVRDWVCARSGLVRRIEREAKTHPFTTTLTLRLIPAAPIALVNLGAGFIRMPFIPYALATLIGVIPSSLLYASVGSGLGGVFASPATTPLLQTLRQQLTFPAVGVLALAILPLAIRWWHGRRVAERGAVS